MQICEVKRMASEDITFCMNNKCNYMKCERNPKHIKQHWMPHSFMYLENTDDCPKAKGCGVNDKRI